MMLLMHIYTTIFTYQTLSYIPYISAQINPFKRRKLFYKIAQICVVIGFYHKFSLFEYNFGLHYTNVRRCTLFLLNFAHNFTLSNYCVRLSIAHFIFGKPTMASDYLKCGQYCGRCDFKSLPGLTQHWEKTKYCFLQHQALFGDDSGYHTAHGYTETVNVVITHGRTNAAFIARQLEHVSAQKHLMSALSKSLLHTTNPTCAQKGASALNLAQNQLQL